MREATENEKIAFKAKSLSSNDLTLTGNIPFKSYFYKPKEDITVYELALIMHVFFVQNIHHNIIATLPECARRHFEEVKE